MIIFSLRGKAAPEHCNELVHFVTSVLEDVRLQEGCLECHCYRSVEDNGSFYLFERWSSSQHLETHMNSELYSVISGAFSVLTEDARVEISSSSIYKDRKDQIGEGVI